MGSLNGKVVWITGASSGIGESLTYAFAKEGAKLILSSRRKDELERVKGNCPHASQPDVRVLALDLAEPATLQLTAEAAIQLFGHIDILVNNGGISQRGLAKDTIVDVDRRIMEVNYFGAMALTKAVMPHFIQRKSGHFVVISSVAGMIGLPFRTSYAAAKHALHGFFDSLRAELWNESKDIHVTIICPGWISTKLSINALVGNGQSYNKVDENNHGGMTPDELAVHILRAVRNKKEEVYIGGMQEKLAIYLKRFIPGPFSKIIRKTKVSSVEDQEK